MDNQSAPATRQTKGIKKLWLKIKASMKADGNAGSKAPTTPATSKPATTTTTTTTTPVTESAPAPVETPSTKVTEPATTPESNKVEEDVKPTRLAALSPEVIEVDDDDEEDEKLQLPAIKTASAMSSDKQSTALRYQRAQDVFKKYDMTLDPAEWQHENTSNVDRVEKKTRMRVRYSCHQCNETFGRAKTCSSCSHVRCGTCVRHPLKKTGDKSKQRNKAEAVPASIVAPITGACHECKTDFKLGATECANCNHQICATCLKEIVLASPATAPPLALPTPQPIAVAAA